MPNIASLFKEEIIRVARKEIRTEVAALRKSATTHRAEIAALKRRAADLERELRVLAKLVSKTTPAPTVDKVQGPSRFSAKGLATQRNRLGLSAAECGLLIGASGQSIYNWESGSARPRAIHLAAIAVLRTLGKKEANARLVALLESGK